MTFASHLAVLLHALEDDEDIKIYYREDSTL